MAIGSKDINQKPVSGTPDTEPKFPDGSKTNKAPSKGTEGLYDSNSSDETEGDIHHVQHRPLDRSREHAPDDTFPGSGPAHLSE